MVNRKPNEVPAALKNINLKAVLRKQGIHLKLKENQRLKEAMKPIAQKMISKTKEAPEVPKYSNFSNAEAEEYRLKQVRIVTVVEEKFKNKLEQYISKVLY